MKGFLDYSVCEGLEKDNNIREAIAEHHKADAETMEKIKGRFLKMAETEEERAEIEQGFKEMMEEEK